jgi:hypothetical protein
MINLDLMQYLPEYYRGEPLMPAIMETVAKEIGTFSEVLDDVLNQIFLYSATWGLELWENDLGLSANENLSLDLRRAKIKALLMGCATITDARMTEIINQFTASKTARVEEAPELYGFRIILPFEQIDFQLMLAAVEEMKPKHLGYGIVMNFDPNHSKMYIGSILACGEIITVYPWMPPDLTTSAAVVIGTALGGGSERTTVYPKGA